MDEKIIWEIIKNKWEAGDKPQAIATEFAHLGITSKQVRDKAYRNKWVKVSRDAPATIASRIIEKAEQKVVEKLADQVESEIADRLGLLSKIDLQALKNVLSDMQFRGARVQDGDKPIDYIHKQVLNTGLKYYNRVKEAQAKANPNDEPPGFNIILPPDD